MTDNLTADTAGTTDSADTVGAVDAVVVGAGFAGLYALHRLRGQGLDVRAFEAGSDVGGTWFWNRYPGARCDIESVYYCYSFDEELTRTWEWTERYAAQPEILGYLRHVADRLDLRRDITFDTRVRSARFDEESERWEVATDGGERVSARFLVLAVGLLSSANLPDIPGRDEFAGPVLHTGRWPHEPVDLAGQRVGVIGTGSSGIQAIPLLAQQAEHLTVFQRTPNFSLPARNGSPDAGRVAHIRANHAEVRRQLQESSYGILLEPPTQGAMEVSAEEREETYRRRWEEGTLTGILQAYNDLVRNQESNDTASEFVRRQIARVVRDPETAEDLTPRGYAYGTKRPCLDTGYYETFNRSDVRLVNLRRTPIERITPTGVRTTDEEHPLDVLVFATGYDAMTGSLLALDIVGRDGVTLREKWAEGPTSYLGIAVSGFPNMFTITGPGSPSALSNAVISIEQHVDWLTDLVAHLSGVGSGVGAGSGAGAGAGSGAGSGAGVAEATPVAEKEWTEHVQQVSRATLYPDTDSWYLGANIPGKPRVFLPYIGGVGNYRRHCDRIAAEGYPGFTLHP